MPLLLLAIGAALLMGGEGINLAGQGSQKIAQSTTQTAVVMGALYLAYLALAKGKG